MKRRKLERKVRKLQRRVEVLEALRGVEVTAPLDVSGDPLDVIALWMTDHVSAYMHGWDDDEDWSARGYL